MLAQVVRKGRTPTGIQIQADSDEEALLLDVLKGATAVPCKDFESIHRPAIFLRRSPALGAPEIVR